MSDSILVFCSFYLFCTGDNKWVRLNVAKISTDDRSVKLELRHFSPYGVAGPLPIYLKVHVYQNPPTPSLLDSDYAIINLYAVPKALQSVSKGLFNNLIFTKPDECASINIALSHRQPYFTKPRVTRFESQGLLKPVRSGLPGQDSDSTRRSLAEDRTSWVDTG